MTPSPFYLPCLKDRLATSQVCSPSQSEPASLIQYLGKLRSTTLSFSFGNVDSEASLGNHRLPTLCVAALNKKRCVDHYLQRWRHLRMRPRDKVR